MDGCTIEGNYSWSNGGGINWEGIFQTIEVKNSTFTSNWAGASGGAIAVSGLIDIVGCEFYNNEAYENGGGIAYGTYSTQANLNLDGKIKNGTISLDENTVFEGNTAWQGGAISMIISPIVLNLGGTPKYVFKNDEGQQWECSLELNGAKIKNNSAVEGGGIFLRRYTGIYKVDLNVNYGEITGNEAYFDLTSIEEDWGMTRVDDGSGAGIVIMSDDSYDNPSHPRYHGPLPSGISLTNFNVTFGDSEPGHETIIEGNEAETVGGGAYIYSEYTCTDRKTIITMNSCTYGSEEHPNKAVQGGGLYINGGDVTFEGGTLQYNQATGTEITGTESIYNYGGGLYVNGGNVTINNGEIVHNSSDRNAGAVYTNGGDLTIKNGNIDDNHADVNGGGFYMNGGNLYLYGGVIGAEYGNEADEDGGGFYLNGGHAYIMVDPENEDPNPTSAAVQYNKAKNGAGLYMAGNAIADFENGTIKDNAASTNGGGVYLAGNSHLNMSGASTITGNHVPATGKGGGVFKHGGTDTVLKVGGTALQIDHNYAGVSYTSTTRNNTYLDAYSDYITVDETVGLSDNVKIGISVNVTDTHTDLPTPVIHCTSVEKINQIFYMLKHPNGDNGVFDDASRYVAVYQSHPEPFNSNEIFFIATWVAEVEEIEDFDATKISNPEELAYFMVLVNGLNGHTADPDLQGTVIADIDMSEFYWTPIGEWDNNDGAYNLDPEDPNYKEKPIYIGTFDGQGHTITGLNTCGIIGYFNYGLFGHTGADANISNVVLADCNFQSGETARMGNLIAEMDGGVAENCIVSGTLNPSGSETIEDNEHSCVVGGLIGEAKGAAQIRNCIATEMIDATSIDGEIYPGMQAFTVGGLVGMTSAGTVIENCFANPEIHHSGRGGSETDLTDYSRYVGGLIGENYGIVRNCYVRLERSNSLTGTVSDPNVTEKVSKFGMFAGLNSNEQNENATIVDCYYPASSLRNGIGTYGLFYTNSNTNNTSTHYGEYGAVTRPYTYTSYLVDNQVDGGTSEATTLLSKLNSKVTATNGYSRWMRTEGSDVNDDYPVLSYDNLINTLNYTTVGSKDGIHLEYDNRFNEMYSRFATEGEGCLFIYRTPWTGTIASPADEVIGNGVTVNNSGTDIKVFVEDGVALLQDAGSTLVNTYTCHEFNDASRSWHHISSSLNNDSPIGFNYTQNAAYNEESNPCGASVATGNYASFLPAGIPMADLDLYCFYETEYHWINFKRNTDSHWHMNDQHQKIAYTNETNLVAGKGYLASFAGRTFVQAGGELTNGYVEIEVTAQAGSLNASASPAIPADEGTELKGYNLLGNPYQSYLDIAAFMAENSSLLVNTGKSGIDVPSYAIYDSEANAYVQGMASKPSLGSRAASDQIKMHEGFFIYTANDGEATFTNDMRCTEYTPTGTKRAEQPAYPLVNLVVTDESGESDIAVAEFGRTQTEGAAKMKQIGADGKIYFHYADDDYALLYLNEDTDRLPVHFDAIENGTYTMTWSTANATFSYLHLVDNMTGMDIDMLSSDAYTFTASSSDYKSRFKLMFAYTGVEENAAASTSSASFAFMHDGALTVNGEGWLEVIDMSGRTIVSSRLTDAQNTVSLPQAAQGVYVLRLTNDNQSKVQKIVIE